MKRFSPVAQLSDIVDTLDPASTIYDQVTARPLSELHLFCLQKVIVALAVWCTI
jgi:hypothetical protein